MHAIGLLCGASLSKTVCLMHACYWDTVGGFIEQNCLPDVYMSLGCCGGLTGAKLLARCMHVIGLLWGAYCSKTVCMMHACYWDTVGGLLEQNCLPDACMLLGCCVGLTWSKTACMLLVCCGGLTGAKLLA